MDSLSNLRDAWGGSHFVTAPGPQLARLELSASDRELLARVGLPVAPASALHLELRFESVDIHHRPADIGLLSETNFRPSRFYPRTGDPDVDAWASLDRFVVLGNVRNDGGSDESVLTRFVCLDAISGRVCWVSPTPSREGHSVCYVINTSLASYLASLLAYKQFRDHWPDLEVLYKQAGESSDDLRYYTLAERIHADFLRDLEAADPVGFKDGFWQAHAWNEAILLEL